MTTALDRARALLDTPPTAPVPGQLDILRSHAMPDRPANLPALAVPCPTCQSAAGQLCTSHSGTRQRRHDVHQTRTAAFAAFVDSVEIALTGGCGLCDTEAIELCAGCDKCRCHRHDTCTRPTAAQNAQTRSTR